jgi:hypothetical protein
MLKFEFPIQFHVEHNRGCVTLWPCHLHYKKFNAKEELSKVKYFTKQKYNLQKHL